MPRLRASSTSQRGSGAAFIRLALLVLMTGSAVPLLAQGPPQLPPQASPVAQTILDGELEVEIEDADDGSQIHHFLKTSTGRVRLELASGEAPGWQSGMRVRARGRMKDATTLELGSPGDVEPMALANSHTFAQQKTLVILVNFSDNRQTPYTLSHASNVTFNTVSDFFLENSHGQTWLAGDVVGWFELPMSSSGCDYNQISSRADQAAAAAGVNVGQYSRKVYAFPKVSACGWWGLGTVGGNPSRSWINGTYSLKVVAHELGHNFGDYHSRSKACTTSGCSTSEYGDNADVMGNPTSGHMNAFQKERLGWLNYGDSPAVQAVTGSGSYWVETYSLAGSSPAPKALKILKGVDGSGNRSWYYAESRARVGFDDGVSPGVILHTGDEGNAREIYQVDMDPVTSTKDWRLDAGQMFEDTALGVRITTLWTDSTGAMIDVQFDAAPCSAATPSISASPSGTVSTAAGSPVSYSVSVTNHDGSTCGSSSFTFEAWVPTGWSATTASATVSAGSSASRSITITPSSSASGSHSVQIGAYRSGAQGATLTRTISISAPEPPPPPPPSSLDVDLSVSTVKGGNYEVKAVVTADGAPVSGATVDFKVTDSEGGVRTFGATTNGGGEAVIRFKPRGKDPRGSYTVEAVASASGMTATASLSVLVK